jgi:hypothetical protein
MRPSTPGRNRTYDRSPKLTKRYFVALVFGSCFNEVAFKENFFKGLSTSPQAVTPELGASLARLIAAFMSRSSVNPQAAHLYTRSDNVKSDLTFPQR